MIINILKKFFCLILIFFYTFSCYASLTASDGSAFITREEYESSVKDFDSRLTTFEAGLNTKIDSQVSSYLDRNGIWSGSKQDILIEYMDVPSPKSQISAGSSYVTTYSDYKLICKCSKSGMMSIKPHIFGNGFWGYIQKASAATKNLSEDGLSVLLLFQVLNEDPLPNKELAEDPDTIKNVWALYLGGSQPYTYNGTTWPGMYTLRFNWPTEAEKETTTIYFFVTKDDRIYIKFKAMVRISTNDGTTETLQSGNGKIYIDDVYIY